MSDIHTGFQREREAPQSEHLFRFLDAADAMEPIQLAKQLMLALIDPVPGALLLDVGCGVGHEVQRLARRVGPTGQVVGLDNNPLMIAEAKRRVQDLFLPITYEQGDAHALPFADAQFTGCRAERVLLYTPRPDEVIREMARVVRRGGRVVIFDFDYGGTLFDSPDDQLAQRVQAALTASVPNGTIGRRLARYCSQAGLEEVRVQPYPILVPYGMYHRIVAPTLAAPQARAYLSLEEAATWSQAMAAAETAGTFFALFLALIVAGTKP